MDVSDLGVGLNKDSMGGAAIMTCILCFLCGVANAEFNGTPEYLECNEMTEPLSDYQSGVDVVVRDLIASTPHSGYNYYNKYEKGDTEVYGHGICNGLLAAQDCYDCLRVVNAYRIHYCTFVVTAQAKLTDCEITFHKERFHHGGPRH